MENQKNNKGVNSILVVIIVILSALCVLFATDTISFNSNKIDANNTQENSSSDNERNHETEIIEFTESDAKEILKTKLDVTIEFLESSNTYCGPNGFTKAEDILIDNSEPYTYYLINNFNTLTDLENYLLMFMTKEVLSINEYYSQDNYIEQDNKLYCKTLNKSNTGATYENVEINNISSNEITATITVVKSGLGDSISDKVNIKLIKTNDIWKISQYEKINNE